MFYFVSNVCNLAANDIFTPHALIVWPFFVVGWTLLPADSFLFAMIFLHDYIYFFFAEAASSAVAGCRVTTQFYMTNTDQAQM